MTGLDDTDRRIAAWFSDSRGRVPERTIDAVLAHARAHPRRRDPFAALRRDPMGSGGRLGGLVAPLPLVAAVGLLAAALGGAAVGGLFDRGPAVVPVMSPTPSATPDATSGPKPLVFDVDLVEVVGQDASIAVTDASGTLGSAESGQPNDGGSVEADMVQVTSDPTDPNVVVLTWTGSPCDTTHTLAIASDGRSMVLTRPACSGDTIPRDLQLRLRFDGPVSAADVDATLETK
ncbi:MAG: hypothetical protein ACRDIL_03540 [Candidatus Limnocylindrales bacterium]